MGKTAEDSPGLPIFGYSTVFISDIHFGSDTTAAPYLYEFLNHLDFKKLKKLYLVGDIVDGWEHESKKQKPLPEMERRVIDVLNYIAQQGTKVTYVPGNHDEKMRPLLDLLNNRRNYDTFPENLEFALQTSYETGGTDPKKFHVLHGDENDPSFFFKKWFRPVTHLVSRTYDALVRLNHVVSKFAYNKWGKHINFASRLKQSFKGVVGYFFSHDSLLAGLGSSEFDGIISGHTHTATFKSFKDKNGSTSYLINDGDWVEDCNAAVVEQEGEVPQVIDYKIMREEYGFGDLPDIEDRHNPEYMAQRRITDRQVRMLHRLWPSVNREKFLQKFNHSRHKYREHSQDKKALSRIMDRFVTDHIIPEPDRHKLTSIFAETKKQAYKQQKKGIADIFNRYSANQRIDNQKDQYYLQTVIRQFITRSQRKIHKHEIRLHENALKLDMISPARGLTGQRSKISLEEPQYTLF